MKHILKFAGRTVFFFSCLFLFHCCNKIDNQNNKDKNNPIFQKLNPQKTGVSFSNTLKEDSIINYFTYPYIYMGGGVAVGDLNNDDLPDLYFTGNMVKNKLYLNKGNLTFEDISKSAHVEADDRWITGATMADVNADGWLDIYVCVSGKFASTKNLLYINNGLDAQNNPHFTESADQYGLADEGHSTQGTFFDYDKDGDLDLYVANYPFTNFQTPNFTYKYLKEKKSPEQSDKLYRNNGNGTFEDASAETGVLNFGLSLSATVGDFNNDGWEDIYVSNDFASPDHFYFNNKDGTFSDKIKETTQHISFFGMGTDAADFNNDGNLDLLQLDMSPENNRRNKANMASMNIPAFWEIIDLGMHYQYMQNSLQLNQGMAADNLPHFSDISRLAGMSSTDWSWAGLFADFDNDGWKDIFISNGTRRDINNKDYFNAIKNASYQEKQQHDNLDLTKNMPFEKIENYAFRNNGDLSFEPVANQWGLVHKGFSNGSAYADLDNDGDLEIIINNIDEAVSIYENKTSDLQRANYLKIKLIGSKNNPQGIGAKICIKNSENTQYQQLTLTRGFQSSVEPMVYFGIGNHKNIDSLEVTWPDGKQEIITNITANQQISLDHKNSIKSNKITATTAQLFTNINTISGVSFKHKENVFNDFEDEILLPHSYSRNGPALAIGDVNGDTLDDFYVGGAVGQSGVLYFQQTNSSFSASTDSPWKIDKTAEDISACFFDADNDGDLDLYVVSGGNERKEGSKQLQDRLYINKGKGQFSKSQSALPAMTESGSCIKAADYDNDGDIDLFVGARIVPQAYPLPAKSTILRNDFAETGNLGFTDVTKQIAPELLEAGLITDAVWSDFDGDKLLDLVIVGEWKAITFLHNSGNYFEDKTADIGLQQSTGWWYSIISEDFDMDGDMDFVVGNLGKNYKYQADSTETFDVYANDYDKNGKLDIVLGYYSDGVQYPVRGRQCSSEQIPTIKYKYKDYDSYAASSLVDIYTTNDLQSSLHYQAQTFASQYIENMGNDNFKMTPLPNEAQLSAINGIVADDFNRDGFTDIVIAGNMYGSEIETPRNDASYGLFMAGDGEGNFEAISMEKSGLFIKGDTKKLKKIRTNNGILLIAAKNNDNLDIIKINK